MYRDFNYDIRLKNYDNDISPNLECAKTADAFSHKIIPVIIKDDSDLFLEIVSSPEFDHDGTLLQARERFYLSDYLYQPFFDELTGPTVLSVAAFFKAEKIVEAILSLPIVDKTDSFHFACAGGSLNIVRMLFDQEECDRINKDNVRPITIASYFGNVDVVKYLYSHGCRIIHTRENNSCINKAAFNGNINVLDFFREIDPKLIQKIKDYYHPINSAAKGGQPECVNYLLKYGKPSKGDIYGALISACQSGSLSCVKILLQKYLNYDKLQKDREDKKVTKRRKMKDDDEEFDPSEKKAKKKKKRKNDDSDDDESENEKVEKDKADFINICKSAISNYHIDVLRYLLSVKPMNSMDFLLSYAIFQINYVELLSRIHPPNYLRSSHLYEQKEAIYTKLWLKKSAHALRTAKFVLMNYDKSQFSDNFFQQITNVPNINSVIYFFNEINFKISSDSSLTQNQAQFFRDAILMANKYTIPMLKKIMNNTKQEIFSEKFFDPLKDKRKVDLSDPNYYLNEEEQEEEKEILSYVKKESIINTFRIYALIIIRRDFSFDDECALFLMENHFPYYLLTDISDLNINTFTMNLPFFKACLKSGCFDYAKKFLLQVALDFYFDALLEIYEEMNKKFNPKYDPKADITQNIKKFKENRFESAMRFINIFNQSNDHSNNQLEFNIFNYKPQNEEENELYQQYMSLIKMIIRIASNNPDVAVLLCSSGLSKEWIIEQTKDETDDLINPIPNSLKLKKRNTKSNSAKIKSKIEMNAARKYPFLTFLSKNQISDDWYMNSLNPLINTTLSYNFNNILQISTSSKVGELLKYYINNGLDVSNGTEYSELLWKKVIENNKGEIARYLIQFGNADKNLFITDSDSQDISLFDFALEKKSVSILFVFFENEFYPQDSLINNDPNEIVVNLNNEEIDSTNENLREINLKIISLIYKYKIGNYDLKLKKRVIKELSSLMVPSANTKKCYF